MAADLLNLPPDVDRSTLFAADFRGPTILWIDPLKEVKADVEAVEAGFKSRSQVIRERGVTLLVCVSKLRWRMTENEDSI